MSLSLGTLEIGLGLNTAQYDSGIKSAKDQLSSLDQETAQILLEAMKAGQVPVFATQIIVDCGLYDEIIQLIGEKS